MNIPTIQPPRLRPGDTISIVAPAGTLERDEQRESFGRGIAALERLGFRVRYDERIFHSMRYLAGNDEARAEELMRAFEDPSVRAVMALRGGYGCSRLIPLLSARRLRRHPKLFIGFSDLTTLHMYFNRRFGWITIHGPMAASASLGDMAPDEEKHLLSLLTDPGYRPILSFPQLEPWVPGAAEGILTGGCLSIVEAGIATPYEARTRGKILFLEDLGEPPYKLDRMLTHLRLASRLQSLSGLILGSFVDCDPGREDYTALDTLRELLSDLKIPLLAGFPAGHGHNNWALPLGARVRVGASERSIEFLEPAVS